MSPLRFNKELVVKRDEQPKRAMLDVPKMGSFKGTKKVKILDFDCDPIEEKMVEESPMFRKKKLKIVGFK